MELQVCFDRTDRLYQSGDVISGSVVLQPDADRTYSEIWLTYRWRTHGQGDQDQGSEEKLILAAEKTTLGSGELRKFPFRFAAPGGPVTYHGSCLNVDWYVAGHAKSGPLHHVKSECDFLLRGPDRVPASLVREETGEDVTSWSTGAVHRHGLLEMERVSPVPPGKWYAMIGAPGILFAALVIFLLGLSSDSAPMVWFAVVIALIAGAYLVIRAIGRNSYGLKLRLDEAWITPDTVNPGGEVRCHVDFVAKRAVHLDSISASITLRERFQETAGTTTVTRTNVVGGQRCSRTYDEDLAEGRQIVFECALPVAIDAPASFSAPSNHLEWIVTMKAELEGWPGWNRNFPLTVLS